MSSLTFITLSNLRLTRLSSLVSRPHFFPSCPNICDFSITPKEWSISAAISVRSTAVYSGSEKQSSDNEERTQIRWAELSPNLTEEQRHGIFELPSDMSNRCKALMRQIICFDNHEGDLHLLLSSWVKSMKPRRADWLVVLKEMKRLDSPMLLEVMEFALLEDSFEPNIRDYTKIIDAYAKKSRLSDAESAFLAMKRRGLTCDQVALTVLVNNYSKVGDFNRAKEMFEEIKLLGVPIDKRAYGAMIMAYIRAGMPDHGEKLLQQMDSQETYACREVYKALLRAYSIAGDSDGAQRVFDAIQFAGMVPDAKLCALLINAYCAAGQSDKARSTLANMKLAGLMPNDKCIALLLAAYEKDNNLDEAMSLLMELERECVAVGEEASQILIQWFSRLGLAEEAEHVVRELARTRKKMPTVAIDLTITRQKKKKKKKKL